MSSGGGAEVALEPAVMAAEATAAQSSGGLWGRLCETRCSPFVAQDRPTAMGHVRPPDDASGASNTAVSALLDAGYPGCDVSGRADGAGRPLQRPDTSERPC
jgi:hypothetical protein